MFEFSSQSGRLNFPNPLRIHNWFLFGSSLVALVASIILLVSVRDEIANGSSSVASYYVIAMAVATMAAGVRLCTVCLSQLRFYFGRGRPRDIAPVIASDARGTSPTAEKRIKEPLRQQAITYLEPQGALAGLLYSAIPNLIYAPPPLRRIAESQFRDMVVLAVLAVGLLATLAVGIPAGTAAGNGVADWIGFVFTFAALWVLVRPRTKSDADGELDGAIASSSSFIFIATFAIVGPAVLSLLVRSLSAFVDLPPVPVDPFPHVFVLLGIGIAVHAMFFVAVILQLLPPPGAAVSMVQEAWNISCNPSLITSEFLRAMQESWPERIPNRRYSYIEPSAELSRLSGSFQAEIIEETQPFPLLINQQRTDQISPSGAPTIVAALDAAGAAFTVGAACLTVVAGRHLLDQDTVGGPLLIYVAAFWALGFYSLNAAQRLWLRFDFTSRLVWLELDGQFVSAKVDQGNVHRGDLRSKSSMFQIEGMTFRLWMAQIKSVAFGRDAPRYITEIAGMPDAVGEIVTRLRTFADSQASIAALGNSANAQRLAATNAVAQAAAAPFLVPGSSQSALPGSDPS